MKNCWILPGVCCAAVISALACSPSEQSSKNVVDAADPFGIELAAAESVYYRGDYDSVRAMLHPLAEKARTRGDTSAEARALTWLGLTAWREGDYAEARKNGERALELKLSAKLDGDLFRSYNALGLLAHNQGRYAEAIEYFTSAESAARKVADSAGIAKALGNRGLSLVDMGEFEKAREGFAAMRQMAESTGDSRTEANALANLAMLDIRLGDPLPAIEGLMRSRSLYKQAENPAGEENVLGQLGTAYDALGDPRRTIAYLDSAVAVAREHGLSQQESEDLQLLAAVFDDAGDHVRTLQYLSRAREISEKLEQVSELGDIAFTEARALSASGRIADAMARATEARTLHTQSAARLEVLRDNLLLAELAQRSGNPRSADEAIAAASRIAAAMGMPVVRAEIALGKARLADLRKDSHGTIAALQGIDGDLPRLSPGVEWEIHALRARAHKRAGSLSKAADAGRLAVRKLEEVRGRIGSGVLRASYADRKADVYAELAIVLLEKGEVAEAFAVADAARGRSLLEHIGAAGRSLRTRRGQQLVDADRLLRRIDWLVERLNDSDTTTRRERGTVVSATLSSLQGQLGKARGDYESLMRRIESGDPEVARIGGAEGRTAAAVRRSLKPDEVMIQFLLSSDRIVSFAVTRDTIVAIQSNAGSEEVASRVRLAIDAARVSSADDATMRVVLRRLSDLLILPVERTGLLAGKRTLIIIPHSSIVHLPFAALMSDDTRYLVERYAVLTLPSAAALPQLRARSSSRSSATSILAPFPKQLPGTLTEANTVKRATKGSRSFTAGRATEKVLREELYGSAVVHVASHAILNEVTPMFSRVELAPSARRRPSDDGRLETHEILGLALDNDLVFLSGCETAAGLSWSTSFRRSEDYATLSQAFLFAGARNVIATLWRIDDQGAADIAGRFYRHAVTADPVASLASAQREMISGKKYAAPRYWAAYTISGAGLRASTARIAAR